MTTEKIKLKLLVCGLFFASFLGCADLNRPTMNYAFTHPWSAKPPFYPGMTKEKIKAKWGSPDIIRTLGYDELGLAKEEWVYQAKLSKVPVDYSYLAKTKYLYFNGNALIAIKDEEEVEQNEKK